jgi:predicted lipid-binding transport protein (Tim44 family)
MQFGSLCALLLCTLPAVRSAAQESPATPSSATPPAAPAQDIPRPDQLEPGVTTTPTPASAAPPAGAGQSSAGAAPGGAGKSATAAAKPAAAARKGPDRLELDTTDITGNRELPKVLYIVPWKHADLGDLAGRPPNSLLDEVLQPLDRDVFQRENRYYEALKPGQAASKTDAPQGSGPKP